MRFGSQMKGGFYPTPEAVTTHISEHIFPHAQRVRGRKISPLVAEYKVLDPCCGEAEAITLLAENMREDNEYAVKTYGIELQQERSEISKAALDNFISGDFFNTMIANNTFSVLFLNPPYDEDAEEKRMEHQFLVRATRYLVADGILIYIIPKKRIFLSAKYLSAHYNRLTVWYFPEPEREDFDQVVIFGVKRQRPVNDEAGAQQLIRAARGTPPSLYELNAHYFAPTVANGEIMFDSTAMDPLELSLEARKSGLWNRPAITEKLWPAEIMKSIPLMPLRRGHMALLIAAGFLDNLVLTHPEDGTRILVKGRTTKAMINIQDDDDMTVDQEQMKTTVVSLDLTTGEIVDIV